jgi:tRNA/tmRNA/rRNA uracil-C5-methylase (TrmA/RlmC/RlmD family)
MMHDVTQVLADHPGCNPLCRACHYKNLTYDQQLQRKEKWATTQLQKWEKVLKPVIPAPLHEQTQYRAKSWMRAEIGAGQVSFGMQRSIQNQEKWEKEFISWDSCPLHIAAIQDAISKLKKCFSSDQIEEMRQSWVGVWFGVPHIVIVSRDNRIESFQKISWDQILQPPFESAWFHFNPQVGKKIFGHHEIYLLSGPSLESDHPIRAFRQVARGLLSQARMLAVEYLVKGRPSFVLDLYCGTGEIASLLPMDIGWIGIEISPDAVQYANSQSRGDRELHVAYTGSIEDRLKDPRVLVQIKGHYSIYVNPPRSGISDEAREKLIEVIRMNRPSIIVYLSCSASSLSRDLSVLEKENYTIELLQPFDFFPQTEHFETLAILNSKI